MCMCSIYFVLWATSFNLYEWLEYADARDALGDGCSLSSRPVTAPMESLPKREKHTRRREKSRPTAMRSPPNSSNARIRFVLRVGKGVRASISLGNSSCRILMQFCRIAVSVIVIGAKCGSHASQKRTVDAARRRPRDNRLQLKECIPRRLPEERHRGSLRRKVSSFTSTPTFTVVAPQPRCETLRHVAIVMEIYTYVSDRQKRCRTGTRYLYLSCAVGLGGGMHHAVLERC